MILEKAGKFFFLESGLGYVTNTVVWFLQMACWFGVALSCFQDGAMILRLGYDDWVCSGQYEEHTHVFSVATSSRDGVSICNSVFAAIVLN